MEEIMKTTKPEAVLVQAMMRREITKLDDEELWAEFEPLEIDKIESGEIKPKTLITNSGWIYSPEKEFRERGHLIVKEMLSVFPNSTSIKWKGRWNPNSLEDLIVIAKKRECTSLVLVYANLLGHEKLCIVSLLNGAAAYFRIFDLITREDIPDQANPPRRLLDPYVRLTGFTSQADLGLSRLIRSLFPKATHSTTYKTCPKNLAVFQNTNGFVHYRHHWLHSEKAALSEERPKRTPKEAGPRFKLLFEGVKKVSLETGSFKRICMNQANFTFLPALALPD